MEAVERLRLVAARLAELGADGAWLAGVLQAYLDPFGTCTLDEAAGVLPAPGAEHWRTVARRALRDDAVRQLAALFPGLRRTPVADKIWKMLIGYATTRWRVDGQRSTMPEGYRGTPRAHLRSALVAGDGRVPGESTIRRLLAISSPLFIAKSRDDNPAHDSSTPDDHQRRDEQRRSANRRDPAP
jgi:hypothetical protein